VARERPYKLIADHPALDFANTLDDRNHPRGPIELLTSYGDVLRFATQARLLTAGCARALGRIDGREATRAVRQARALREIIQRLFAAVADGRKIEAADAARLNQWLMVAQRHRIVRPRTGRMTWAWDDLTRDTAAPLWVLAWAAAELLTSDAVAQVRQCGCETCRWLFLDTSRNHSRRWCDMKICGDRMKARAYYHRQTRSRRPRAR
jgi:predicted RNA-binding Zn ribbon-like protein